MPSNENGNKRKPLLDTYKRMEELKKIYTLVEVKKYAKVPEWIEQLKVAIATFDQMTWINALLNGTEPDVDEYEREKQFLIFLHDIFLCQALFFLPSSPCEHLIRVSQNLNVVCMHGRYLQLRINILGVESYIEHQLQFLHGHLATTNQQNGTTQGPLNSHCIRNKIGNLLSRL